MLTSTTAPGKTFLTRAELAEHYKSDWHKYNLKRREAGLPLLEEPDFQARWEAALALRKEKESKAKTGTDHLKHKRAAATKKNVAVAAAAATNNNEENAMDEDAASTAATSQKILPQKLVESQENPTIDPKQSLFDNQMSDTLQANVDYMSVKYGFFIPDRECLVDLEGLLGYCHEKIKLGHFCLYCEKVFPTWQGCQNHMISKQHTKLRYEKGFWDELDPFYDFKADNEEAVEPASAKETKTDTEMHVVVTDDAGDDGEEGGWEDMSEDGDDEDEVMEGYEREIARFGLDVTPLGELVFPDGRIIGHRALRRYYKQNHRPARTSTAIVAAKKAAGERLYDGQVINIAAGSNIMSREAAKVGSGKGILVPLSKDGGVQGFSALSLYRYRAAVRKQRREDVVGLRLRHRTTLNMNRMDKKANRLNNGVSVAHAAR